MYQGQEKTQLSELVEGDSAVRTCAQRGLDPVYGVLRVGTVVSKSKSKITVRFNDGDITYKISDGIEVKQAFALPSALFAMSEKIIVPVKNKAPQFLPAIDQLKSMERNAAL